MSWVVDDIACSRRGITGGGGPIEDVDDVVVATG